MKYPKNFATNYPWNKLRANQLEEGDFVFIPKERRFILCSCIEREYKKITVIQEEGISQNGDLITSEIELTPNESVIVVRVQMFGFE